MAEASPFQWTDVSASFFGKYQCCTMNKADGMWYADCDFRGGGGCGPLKAGALPAPHQDTPALRQRAKDMHAKAAAEATARALRLARPNLLARIMRTMTGAKAEHDGQ